MFCGISPTCLKFWSRQYKCPCVAAEMEMYENMMLKEGLGKVILYKEKFIPEKELKGDILALSDICRIACHFYFR